MKLRQTFTITIRNEHSNQEVYREYTKTFFEEGNHEEMGKELEDLYNALNQDYDKF